MRSAEGSGVVDRVPELGQRLQRPVQAPRHERERDQRAQRETPEVADHRPDAEHQHADHHGLRVRNSTSEREYTRLRTTRTRAPEVAHELVVEASRSSSLLGAERLDHLDARQDLHEALHHLADLLLAAAARLADARAEHGQHQRDRRPDHEQRERELPREQNARRSAPSSTTPRSSRTSPKICDCSRLATAVSLVSRAIASPRESRWCRASGSAQELRGELALHVDQHARHHPLRRVVAHQPDQRHQDHAARRPRARSREVLADLALQLACARRAASRGLSASIFGRFEHVADRLDARVLERHVVDEVAQDEGAPGHAAAVEQREHDHDRDEPRVGARVAEQSQGGAIAAVLLRLRHGRLRRPS